MLATAAPEGTGSRLCVPMVPEGTRRGMCEPTAVITEQRAPAAVEPEEPSKGPCGRAPCAPAVEPEGEGTLPGADRNPSPMHSCSGQTQRPLLPHSCPAGALLSQRNAPGMPATPCRAPCCSDGDPAHSSSGDYPSGCSRSLGNHHRQRRRAKHPASRKGLSSPS